MEHRTQLRWLGLMWLAAFVVGLGFESPAFRPFELIRTEGPNFKPNRRIEMDAYGALSFRFVIPEVRFVRHNVFTTDDAGFRNPPMPRPSVVVIGDSFVVGVGLSDEETLPRALSRALDGIPVYNYGAQGIEGPPYFLADRRFGRPGELIIYMPSESNIAPLRTPGGSARIRPGTERTARQLSVPTLFTGLKRYGENIERFNMVVNRDNGLRHLARHVFQRWHREFFGSPNQIEAEGAPALVLTLDEQHRTKPISDEDLEEIVDSYLRFRDIAARRQSAFVVAPIPETGSVYEDLFPEDAQLRAVHPTLLERLQTALVERGVETVDLQTTFRAHRFPYLYLRDDTHLDAHAVELAATHLASELVKRGLIQTDTASVSPGGSSLP